MRDFQSSNYRSLSQENALNFLDFQTVYAVYVDLPYGWSQVGGWLSSPLLNAEVDVGSECFDQESNPVGPLVEDSQWRHSYDLIWDRIVGNRLIYTSLTL